MKRKIISTLITIAALSSSSCLASNNIIIASKENYKLAASGKSTKDNLTDASITSVIKTKFLEDEKVRALDISVGTIDGKVTLTGYVPNKNTAERAVSIAQNTNGVEKVINKLTTQRKGNNMNTISDSAITAAIKAKFVGDNKVSALNIHVETNDGVVTLTGSVPDKNTAEKAISIAKNTNGVKEIISELDISYNSKKSSLKNLIPDSAITTSIKTKFMADDSIKALDIHVETTNGRVALNGKAPNSRVVEKAISIARNTNGVKEVISHIEVE